MRRKLFLLTFFVLTFVFIFTVSASAQCTHSDNWEIKTGEDGILGDWEAINICSSCGLVLADEFNAPVVTSLGYSCYGESFVQGFHVDVEALESYEAYTGQPLELGVVAGASSLVGYSPVGVDGVATHEKAVVYSFTDKNAEFIDIKIINVPNESGDKKIVACAYIISDGVVYYCDNETVDTKVCGISLDEAIDLAENGTAPVGLYEYRQLTLEEMDIRTGHYWFSNNSVYSVRLTSGNNFQRYAAPRMFSRDELPAGSYVVIENGWCARPEIWKVKEDGTVAKNGSRPYGSALDAGVYSITELFKDTVNADGSITESDYKYISFNISDTGSSDLRPMTAEGISYAFQIFVPYDAKVEKVEIEKAESVSVAGMQLLEWNEENLIANAYWNCTSSTTIAKSATGTGSDYYATKKFTKEELPVGSVIEINGDFVCRFEYWVNGAKVGTRGALYDGYRIVITEDFWDTESERAFNISHISKEGSLSAADRELIENSIKIYVPVTQ